jgi:hypothetical protein
MQFFLRLRLLLLVISHGQSGITAPTFAKWADRFGRGRVQRPQQGQVSVAHPVTITGKHGPATVVSVDRQGRVPGPPANVARRINGTVWGSEP